MPSYFLSYMIVSVKIIVSLVKRWHLLARAISVADGDNKITYVEYLDNINTSQIMKQ